MKYGLYIPNFGDAISAQSIADLASEAESESYYWKSTKSARWIERCSENQRLYSGRCDLVA